MPETGLALDWSYLAPINRATVLIFGTVLDRPVHWMFSVTTIALEHFRTMVGIHPGSGAAFSHFVG